MVSFGRSLILLRSAVCHAMRWRQEARLLLLVAWPELPLLGCFVPLPLLRLPWHEGRWWEHVGQLRACLFPLVLPPDRRLRGLKLIGVGVWLVGLGDRVDSCVYAVEVLLAWRQEVLGQRHRCEQVLLGSLVLQASL